jgi:hypothetical protein
MVFVGIVCLLLAVLFFVIRSTPESSFDLAPESRIPAWFTIPKGLSRADVKVTMDCYIDSSGRSSVFRLLDKNGKTLAKVNTITEGLQPHYFGNTKRNKWGGFDDPTAAFPLYEVDTANGIAEVTEQKRMEAVFTSTTIQT